MCSSNYNRFSDRARYWSKIVILSYPLAFDAPVKGVPNFPSEHRHPVCYGKTRMAWLPDGEKISEISFVFAQLTNVTDRRTPGDGIYRAYAYASRGKNDTFTVICRRAYPGKPNFDRFLLFILSSYSSDGASCWRHMRMT